MKICNTCNFSNDDSSYICGNCGASLENQPYQNNNYGDGMNNYGDGMNNYGAGMTARYSPMAIAAVSTAGGALLFTCCCAMIGVVAGIVATVLGFMGKKQIEESNGMLKGKELCMIGMIAGPILALLSIAFIIISFAWNGTMFFYGK